MNDLEFWRIMVEHDEAAVKRTAEACREIEGSPKVTDEIKNITRSYLKSREDDLLRSRARLRSIEAGRPISDPGMDLDAAEELAK